MMKYVVTLIFFLLFEIQSLTHISTYITPDMHIYEYSPYTALGLIVLSVYQLMRARRKFKGNRVQKYTLLKKGGKIIVGGYLALITFGIIFGPTFGAKFLIVLITTALGITFMSFYEHHHKRDKKEKLKMGDFHATQMSSFTIPVLFLYVVNFLISAQIGQNIAFQFMLFLSTIILFDLLKREEYYLEVAEKGKMNENELKHYIFHRWSKYYNYFLGLWYFVGLADLGVYISEYCLPIFLFFYTIIFITVTYRMVATFNKRDFTAMLIIASGIAVIQPILLFFLNIRVPAYFTAMGLFFAYDLGDIYLYNRIFIRDKIGWSMKFWGQKAVLYALMAIFIVQLYNIGENPLLNIDNVYTSVLSASSETVKEVAAPSINVSDPHNAVHVR